MEFVAIPVEEEYSPPRPEKSTVLFELIEGDCYLFKNEGVEFGEIQYEGGSADIEAEAGMLEDAVAGLLAAEHQKVGWWVMEGFYGSFSKDYYGEVDCDFECDRVRPATDEDRRKFGVLTPFAKVDILA
jgi:hypothetical protein